ncbi:MAG: hypothetical protein WBY44_07260 [Bryobacteraceae bacterium]|jgi:hypothetical protein
MSMLRSLGCAGILLSTVPGVTTVDLQPHTVAAFDRYTRDAEERLDRQAHGPAFLWADGSAGRKNRMSKGEAAVEPFSGNGDVDVPDGAIHDWVGAVFIPRVTLAKAIALAQDYDSHKALYGPELQDSKIIHRDGGEFDIYLRLLKKQVITVVLNTNHRVNYSQIDGAHWYNVSHSTRIAEVENPGEPDEREMPPGHDHGFLWRLNSYWRFEQRDGGVYVECEAISLTRAVPAGFGWLVNPIVRTLPRDSLANTLRSMRSAAMAR